MTFGEMTSSVRLLLIGCCFFSIQVYAAKYEPKVRPSCVPGAIDTSTVRRNSTIRLRELRKLIANTNAHAYLIFNEAENEGHLLTAHDRQWCYMTDVCKTGGMVVITHDKALIWTVGAKYEEAKQTMDCHWTLMDGIDPRVPSVTAWLIQELYIGNSVHVDSRFITIEYFKKYEAQLATGRLVLKGKSYGLVDKVWNEDAVNPRPEQSKKSVVKHDIKYAGKAWQDKLDDLRKKLKENSADAIALTGLDDIAWLFNIRGSEFLYTPLPLAFAVVTELGVKLYLRDYINQLKTASLRTHLNTQTDGSCIGQSGVCVEVGEYGNDFYTDVADLSNRTSIQKILLSQIGNYHLLTIIVQGKAVIKYSLVAYMREVKNSVEREGMKKAFIKHGVGVIQHLAQLEKEVKAGTTWSELNSIDALDKRLMSQQNYRGYSFEPFIASGDHSSILSYRPTTNTNRNITAQAIYLQNAGSQFLEGTTDGTRILHFGTPTDYEKEIYTRVLKGHIDMATLVWPSYLEGSQLRFFAVAALWETGLDISGGVGHGIGSMLKVKERPACMWQKCSPEPAYMKDGIFTSIQPAYYEAGKFGVRLESIYMVEKRNFTNPNKKTTYLGFTPVSMVPFEPHLIKTELLTHKQLEWLNNYHAKVENIMGKELLTQGLTDELAWVKNRTNKLLNAAMY